MHLLKKNERNFQWVYRSSKVDVMVNKAMINKNNHKKWTGQGQGRIWIKPLLRLIFVPTHSFFIFEIY